MTKQIKIITCSSGDWVIVEVDNEVALEGHPIDPAELLKLLGHDVQQVEISDEDMEYLEGSGISYDDYKDGEEMLRDYLYEDVSVCNEWEDQMEWEKHREESYGGNC